MITPKNNVSPIAPAGMHPARLVWLTTVGRQETKFGKREQLYLTWELVLEPLGEESDENFHLSSSFTSSSDPKSNLFALVKGWLGVEINENFNLETLLGKECMLNVQHGTKDTGTFANIETVTPVPKGFNVPEAKSEVLAFDIDNPDFVVLNKLPEWLQRKVEAGQLARVAQPVST